MDIQPPPAHLLIGMQICRTSNTPGTKRYIIEGGEDCVLGLSALLVAVFLRCWRSHLQCRGGLLKTRSLSNMLEAVNRKLAHLQSQADQIYIWIGSFNFCRPAGLNWPRHGIRREQLLNFANHSAELLIRRRAKDRATRNADAFLIKDGCWTKKRE